MNWSISAELKSVADKSSDFNYILVLMNLMIAGLVDGGNLKPLRESSIMSDDD